MTLRAYTAGPQYRRRSTARSGLGGYRLDMTWILPPMGMDEAAIRSTMPVFMGWLRLGDPPFILGVAQTPTALRGAGAAGYVVLGAADRRGFGMGQIPGESLNG